jgi:hypothetical protein
MKARGHRRSVGTRSLLVVLAALALALLIGTNGSSLLWARSTLTSATALLKARASAELRLLNLQGRHLVETGRREDARGDSGLWVFGRSGTIERPRARTSLDRLARSLARGPRRLRDVPNSDFRFYVVPIVVGGTREGTLVTELSLARYEQGGRLSPRAFLALTLIMLVLIEFAALKGPGREASSEAAV